MILLQQKNQLAKVMETNEMSARYGLALTEQEAELLVSERIQTLRAERRVEDRLRELYRAWYSAQGD